MAILGSNPGRVAVTESTQMQLLTGAGVPASLKPQIISSTPDCWCNVGTQATSLRETGAVTSGPSVQVVNKGKAAKLKGVASQVMRKQTWDDLVQAGVPPPEINRIAASETLH